ncbi:MULTISPECIES: imidazole glycerol phosphate synthase subunit HisH [Chromohalobacter]|jgi:glutamine amidotransferase|uniref:Imidazole glycerol phosphate synthase subunit HisH n=1 Tax=Chromohalobacter israelensis (strain ATCC BAA-138 / DSM 3043 / CIP 106854 / NCIMB 13768 / 1H11) TaxID=290398 RepID=Q1R078_CHRI1|nr:MULTISPECIES: imidazole glycerol phosphate synthase subunit HisH [Chromohalobacter]ABE57880.1 imidazole glycerol phosphate synthase subunit hisH [Chromohalobacter salexigens DSM 3043]MDF9434688.1 imidazole glycerol phosphate synthase subunit HisH [Chromohalobacter israelensis]MDO0946865.1 imidazole glycerol phosphate synthase subunit HisH [Chromohalobacter salexigens]NQY46969.1 imidazole glycerol phosphate synthase subunit HisH [Chromohalobacter sp.]NWO57297.1 imidazole glycerol phosphate s
MTIAVIDYGMGNLHSVAKALEHVTHENVVITDDSRSIRGASRLVLPGQGAIRDCMSELQRNDLQGLVQEILRAQGKPLLGICVGQQMLMEESEENGGVPCLGYLPGRVRHFGRDLHDIDGQRLKVPHMGWNRVTQRHAHPLWAGIDDGARFYFVHSYYVEAQEDGDVFGTTDYAGLTPHVATGRGPVFAVQFHPEKSAHDGLRLLENFVNWAP